MRRRNIAVGLSLRNSYSREVFEGFVEFAATQKHWVLLPFFDVDVLDAELIRSYHVHAVLLNEPAPEQIDRGVALRLPMVNVSNSEPRARVPCIMTDNGAVGQMVADYFIGKGFRSFGFCGTRSRASAIQRLAGFRQGMARLGVEPVLCWHPSSDPRRLYDPKVEKALLGWLEELPKPVGIMAGTDRIASQLADLCSRRGLRVPGDISIVGVGQDELIQKLARLQITSVVLGSRRIGFEAGRMIASLLRGGRAPSAPLLIPPVRIVEGRSTNSGAVNDATIHRATDFMLANLSRSFGIEEVAAATGRSRRSLERHFAATLGTSPHDHLKNLRLEKIRHLIATTDDSLDSIGRLVGLADGSHLSVFFKAMTGERPSEFVRRTREPGRRLNPETTRDDPRSFPATA
ncbi:MAG: substrate-binding domain-containing protein [Opitutaceae bacterium]|nr:substrate-binding domain-containing protein [Opitutaceae bacterium]